jgi:MFS family permease
MTAALSIYARLVRENHNFRRLWVAQIISEVGDWLYAVVIYSLLLDLTGSAQAVASAVILQVLPQVFVSPMAGVINDRISRRTVMILADLLRAGIIAGMVAVVYWKLLWPVYALLFLETVAWSFFEPGRTALLPNLVGERELVHANTLSAITWSFNLAVGSALGGLLAAWLGREPVLVVNAVSFLVSAVLVYRIRVVEQHAEALGRLRVGDLFNFRPILEGFRYIAGNPKLLMLLCAKAGLGIMGAHYVVLPIFGERVFPIDLGRLDIQRAAMLGMSILMGARGVGALMAPLAGAAWARDDAGRMRRGISVAFLAAAVGYITLSAAPNIALACTAVVIAHAGGSLMWVFQMTLLQTATDDRFRGRVFSADFAFLTSTMSLSIFLGGLAVDMGLNVRTLALLVGLCALFPAALWTFVALPRWRHDSNSREPLRP